MTEEPTLSDHGESGSDPTGGDGSERSATATSGADTDRDPADPEPADPTYGWGTYDCARCGSATDRVWRGEDGLVCPGCKEW